MGTPVPSKSIEESSRGAGPLKVYTIDRLPPETREELIRRYGLKIGKEEQDVGEQPVACAGVDDAPAAKAPPHAPAHLPCFIQLLARQAACVADRAGEAIEEGAAGKAIEVVVGEASAGGGREGQAFGHRKGCLQRSAPAAKAAISSGLAEGLLGTTLSS